MHEGRHELEGANVLAGELELLPNTENEGVQSRLGRRVVEHHRVRKTHEACGGAVERSQPVSLNKIRLFEGKDSGSSRIQRKKKAGVDIQNKSYFLLLRSFLLEEGNKGMGQSNHANVVDRDFPLDLGDVHCPRLAKVHHVLDARVQEDAVKVWVGIGDAVVLRNREVSQGSSGAALCSETARKLKNTKNREGLV